jgi:hypothetical protein
MQQQSQAQYLGGHRLSTSSQSSTTPSTNALLNGLLPSRRVSQTLPTLPSVGSNQSRILPTTNNQLKRSERIKHFILIVSLTIIYAFLLIITIELAITLVKYKKPVISLSSNLTIIINQTTIYEEKRSPIRSFFACVWLFNVLLFFICLFLHLILYQQRSQRDRTRAVFLR